MIRILGQIPDNAIVACSGGPDSMALADFMRRGNKKFSVAFIHHGTEASDQGHLIVQQWCNDNHINFHFHKILEQIPKGRSKEEFWREERYKFLTSFGQPILTAHHLDDVVETWIFTALNGNPFLIPYHNHKRNILRPFLITEKKTLIKWCENRNIKFVIDKSNKNVSFARNRIRHNIVPEALKINPGIKKVLKKKILAIMV